MSLKSKTSGVSVSSKIKMPDSKKILSFIASNRLFLVTLAILVYCLTYGISFSTMNKQMNEITGEFRVKQSMLSFILIVIGAHLPFFIALLLIILLFSSLHLSCPTKCTTMLNFITSNWLFLSAIFLLLGCLFYSVSPFHALREVRYQQQQEDFKQNFIDFHNALGVQLLKIEKVDAAKEEFKKVLDVDNSNLNATVHLTECDIFNKTENSTADPLLQSKKLEMIHPYLNDDPLIDLYSANYASDHNYTDEAIILYKKVIDKDPTVPAAYEGLGFIYSSMGETDLAQYYFEQAVVHYEELVSHNQDNIDYLNNLASTYYELNNYSKAIATYNRIGLIKLKTDPLGSKKYDTTLDWYRSPWTPSEIISSKPSLDSYLTYSNAYRYLEAL